VVIEGSDYPLSTVEVSLQTAGLENSFSNYPNPFVPSRGEVTIIAYDLAEDASVDIEIFSITGQTVKQVVIDAFREAGSHQNDTWGGHNDKDLDVVPGTYFCRITARYVSGREESFRRKIAVIR
jgi:flagellar hook assembly protein FlgD